MTALVAWAAITEAELQEELRQPSKNAFDADIARGVIKIYTEAVERELSRRLVVRGTGYYTEYVTLRSPRSVIETIDRPIISIVDVMESDTRAWSTATALVPEQDYVVSLKEGRLERLLSGMGGTLLTGDDHWWTQGRRSTRRFPSWSVGARTIRIRYRAGFATTSAVPSAPFKDVIRRACARRYKEIERGMQGVNTVTDAAGTVTRFGPAVLDAQMLKELDGEYRRQASSCNTRDTDTLST